MKLTTEENKTILIQKRDNHNREYYKLNKEHIKIINKKYRDKNKDLIREKRIEYYQLNRDEMVLISKEYRQKNKDKVRLADKLRYLSRKKKTVQLTQEQKNKRAEYCRQYRLLNKEKLKIKAKEKQHIKNKRQKERRVSDPLFLLASRIRRRTRRFFVVKGFTKKNKTQDILGCSWHHLKLHMEKKFKSGMSWENINLWQIDHIIPLSSAKNEDELLKLSHYTNLQPLWETENKIKSNKTVTHQPELKLKLQ